MNIFLVPYNWARHVAMALVVGAAGFIAWWIFLFVTIALGPTLFSWGMFWTQGAEGWILLSWVATVIGTTSVFAEQALRRVPIYKRFGLPLFAGLLTFGTVQVTLLITACFTPFLVPEALSPLVEDASFASLRFSLPMWCVAGSASAIGPLIVRKLDNAGAHMGTALLCGPIAAATWHYLNYNLVGDFYMAGGMAMLAWGFVHGLFAWPIPTELYAGWVRVLSDRRLGYRVPVDSPEAPVSERFIGHFPRGLDLYLPVEDGLAELHVSFVRNDRGEYSVRGLSQFPTTVRRFLESVDLHYDPRHPSPLETELSSGDRVGLSDGVHTTWVEFVMLPREER